MKEDERLTWGPVERPKANAPAPLRLTVVGPRQRNAKIELIL
jgi:hypothetical protein